MATNNNSRANLTSRQLVFTSTNWTEVVSYSRTREYIMILNNSTEACWLNMNATPAVSSSVTLASGQALELPTTPIGVVSVRGKTAGGVLEIIEG